MDKTWWVLNGAGGQQKNKRDGDQGRERSISINGSVAFY